MKAALKSLLQSRNIRKFSRDFRPVFERFLKMFSGKDRLQFPDGVADFRQIDNEIECFIMSIIE